MCIMVQNSFVFQRNLYCKHKLFKYRCLYLIMINRISNTPVMSYQVEGFPTLTEIIRINHTITALKKSQDELTKKLSLQDDMINRDDLLQHALEIDWGWKDIRRFLQTITDSFFEKGTWEKDCEQGHLRIIEILRYINSGEFINDSGSDVDYSLEKN